MSVGGARIKARPQLHYAPVPDGVYLGGARSQFVLRGSPVLFRVADTCVPLLEDGATEDDLVAALGTERARPAVRHVVDALRDHGMLLDPAALTAPEPAAEERERFAGSLAHLETVLDDPYAAFARLRSATVLLVGPDGAVGPAARGLRRAGAGRVLTAPDPAAAPDAVLVCVTDAAGLAAVVPDGLAPGTPVVPVLLDDRLMVAGPALPGPGRRGAWAALCERALSWADGGDRLGADARPVADALTGALAGQLLFEALTGAGTPGEAHLVHGPQLLSERVVTDLLVAGADGPAEHALDGAEEAALPEVADAFETVTAVAGRWTGLLRPVADDALPQLPLALRIVEHRTPHAGSVVGWAADQQSATVGAGLEALRRAAPDAGAAGLTEECWLLDGALRLLVAAAAPAGDPGPVGPDTVRVRRALDRTGPPVEVVLLAVPGLDWVLARVQEIGSGAVRGQAWAPTAADAVHDALGTALARAQVRRAGGDEGAVAALRTDALLRLDGAGVAALRKQVAEWAVAQGRTVLGRSGRRDPVLGELPLWCGPVLAPEDGGRS